MKHIYTFKIILLTHFFNSLYPPSNPPPSIFYCFPLCILMTTRVLIFKAWASVLDGLSSTETFLAGIVALLIISLIPISTIYFIQNLSVTPSLKS